MVTTKKINFAKKILSFFHVLRINNEG